MYQIFHIKTSIIIIVNCLFITLDKDATKSHKPNKQREAPIISKIIIIKRQKSG